MEQRDQLMPSSEEIRVDERHSRRVIRVAENYFNQYRALQQFKPKQSEGGQEGQSRLSALENQCQVTLSKLQEMGVDESWLIYNGDFPRWLKIFKDSGQILEEIKKQYGGVPLGRPTELLSARQKFLRRVVFTRPPDDELNNLLLGQVEIKLKEMKRARKMAGLVNKAMADFFR